MHTDSANEAYLKPTSLVTTDGLGNDIRLPGDVRVFMVAGTQHGPSDSPEVTATCQQLSNPNPHDQVVRALYMSLDDWATKDIQPPASRYAKASDGTLVPSLPQSVQGFPMIPGVNYTGWYNPVDLLDKSTLPNMPIPGKSYTVLVPRTDVDGNDIAGVRHPNIEVPVATYTGWALRRAPFAEGEDCALTGQYIPFEKTRDERLTKGDPRLSLEERYKSHDQYVTLVARAADRLVRQRLLLEEDAVTIKTEAAESDVGK